jgi:oligopeptidase B
MAWSCDLKGSEYFTIRVRDLATGIDRDEAVAKTSGGVVWIGDSSGFYYVELDDNHRPVRVRRHRLGAPADSDEVVYEESDPGFFVRVGMTHSGAFVLIEASDHETSEVWLLDRADRQAKPRLVEPRTPHLQYDVEHHADDLIIVTNADGAEDFKVVTAPVAAPGRAHWRDLVPHRPGIMILSQAVLARNHVRLERENARPRIVVRDLETGREHAIVFEDDAYSLGFERGFEFDTDVVRYRRSTLRKKPESRSSYTVSSSETGRPSRCRRMQDGRSVSSTET